MATKSKTSPIKGKCHKIQTKQPLCRRNPVSVNPHDSLDESPEEPEIAVNPNALPKPAESTRVIPPREIHSAHYQQTAVAQSCHQSKEPVSPNQPTTSGLRVHKTAPLKLIYRHASPARIPKEILVRPYNLKDYKQLRLDIKLGGLGPNIGPEQERVISGQKKLRDMVKQWNQHNKEQETSLTASKKIRKGMDNPKYRVPIISSKSADHALPPEHVCHHGRSVAKRSSVHSSRSLQSGSEKYDPIVLPVVRLKGFMKEGQPGISATKLDAKTDTDRKTKTGLDVLRKTKEMDSLAEKQLALLNNILAKQTLEE